MATTARKTKGLDSSMNKLNLSSPPRKQMPTPSKPAPPPESWEEEAEAEDIASDQSTPVVSGTSTPQGGDYPGPPPPTPISPSHRRGKSTDWAAFPVEPLGQSVTSSPRASRSGTGGGRVDAEVDGKRPEKSAATAGRMIAMSLGQKPQKMTDEQRHYERAVREKEKKRIEKEREDKKRAERDADEAKRSVWDE